MVQWALQSFDKNKFTNTAENNPLTSCRRLASMQRHATLIKERDHKDTIFAEDSIETYFGPLCQR